MSCCRGQCCASFTLTTAVVAGLHTKAAAGNADSRFVLDMLMPLTPEESTSRLVRLGYDPLAGMSAASANQWAVDHPAEDQPEQKDFTCRHWSEETRLCTVYEVRPWMCRGFPYEKACRACGHPPVPDE